MPGSIGIDIDVNTTSLSSANRELDKFAGKLLDAKGNVVATGTAAKAAAVDFSRYADAMGRIAEQSRRAAQEAARLEQASQRVGAVQRQLRFAVQNTSFQLSDMAVQFQMGTAASVILAQQVPQLVSGFGVLGAVLGTVAAVGIPAISFLTGWGNRAKEATQLVDALAQSSERLINIHRMLAQTAAELAKSYSQNTMAMREVLKLQAAIASADFAKQMRDQVVALSEMFGVGERIGTIVSELTGFSEATLLVAKLADGIEVTKQEAQAMVDALMALQSAQGVQQQVDAARGLADALAAAAGGAKNLEGNSLEAYRSLLAMAQAGLETQSAIEAATTSVGGLTDATYGAVESANVLAGTWSTVAEQVAAANTRAAAALASTRAAWEAATVDPSQVLTPVTGTLPGSGLSGANVVGDFPVFGTKAGAESFPVYFKKAADQAERLSKATRSSGSGAKGVVQAMKDVAKPSQQFLDQLEQQKEAADALVASLKGLAFGTMTGAEGIGGIFQAITDGAFGKALDDTFKRAADTLSDALGNALRGLGNAAGGLSDFSVASIGTGIGIAATGALNGNAKQIGSGVGSAIGGVAGDIIGARIGGALGAVAGPIGMALGGLLGGAVPSLFGGGRDYTRPTGVAFEGTALERRIQARESFPVDDGNTAAAHIAYAGVVSVVKDFDDVLTRLVKTTTSGAKRMDVSLREGVDVMRAVDLITLEMDRRPTSSIEKGAEERAQRFQERMLEIVGIAQQIASVGRQPLTEAQVAWREFEAQFSAENVKILKTIGFSARQIRQAQREIGRDLATGFNNEMLDTLVDTGDATKRELGLWRNYELKALEDRRVAAVRTAREIGASVDIVQASFRAQKNEIIGNYRDMLDEMNSASREAAEKLAAALQASIGRMTDKLSDLEQKRSEILTELARRAEEARSAERALADARRGIIGSELAPGGPLDLLKTLKGQFNSAISAARGGDASAASTAANLAQQLLQQGQQVYASGSAYGDLFKSVNDQLLSAKLGLGGTAAGLEKRLDAENFSKITEKNTTALLKGLSSVNASIKEVSEKIESLNKRIAATEQKRRVA